MKTYRSIAAMALAATMLASSIMPAAAAVQPVQVDNDLHITDEDWVQEADGYQGKTSVTFEVVNEGGGGEGPGPGPGGDEDPTIFSAYVPTVLPILMDLDGNVVAPTNAKVINGVEDRAIQVEGMEATATGSMELVSMEEAAEAAPDEKVFGFSLAGEDMTGDMASLPIRIEADGELDLDMQAEIPAQSEVRAESEIATVLFTLDWADGSGEDVSSSLTVDWENGLLIPGSNKEAVFKWTSTDSDDKLVSVESSNPEIADVADIMTLSAGEYTGQLPVTVNAKSRGTTTITGELQSGETASFKVEVSEYNASGEPSVDIDGELNEGDTLEPGDITVNVPIITPDGEEDTMPVTPDELPSTELKPGDNEIELEVDVNGQTITIIIHINITSSNPSNGLTQSVQDAQAMGFTFSSYEDGLQIDSFENLQFKSELNVPEQIGDFKVLKIGAGVFEDQTNLTKITLPNTVSSIMADAFSGCENAEVYALAPNLEASSLTTFSGVKELHVSTLTPGNNISGVIEAIGNGIPVYVDGELFEDTTALSDMRNNGFNSNHQWVLCIGDDGNYIDPTTLDFAFGGSIDEPSLSTSTVDAVIPKYVNGCLITTLPEHIVYYQSEKNSQLKTLYIPDSVTKVRSSASISPNGWEFYGYPNSGNIVVTVNNNRGAISGISNSSRAAYLYNDTPRTEDGVLVLDEGINEISDYMFRNRKDITSVVIPNGVTSIGEFSFAGCSNLVSVVIPDSVTTIDQYAFSGCKSLTSVNIPNGVTEIGSHVFSSCESLKSISIPGCVSQIGDYAFYECTSLESVDIQDGVVTIEDHAFYGCTKIGSLLIPDSVTSIGEWAFNKVQHIEYHGSAGSSTATWGAGSRN